MSSYTVVVPLMEELVMLVALSWLVCVVAWLVVTDSCSDDLVVA
jgi:hypothetical protein